MEYMKVSQAAEKWGISARRVRVLCAEGKIEGVVRKGNLYMIPIDAEKPQDGRCNKTVSSEKIEELLSTEDYENIQGDSLAKLSESIRTLNNLKNTVISPQLQQLATTMQSLNSVIVSAIQSDAMQAVLNVGRQIATMVASVDFTPMLKKFSEAVIPIKYIYLLKELKWPIFLIQDEGLRNDILSACQNDKNEEIVAEIIYNYCTDDFLVAMEKDWLECSVINCKRKGVLIEALSMHKQGYYYASTSMLMCQVYGVAADIEEILKDNGLSLSKDEKAYVAELYGMQPKYIDNEKGKLFQTLMFTESGVLLWDAMADYLKDVCLCSKSDYSEISNQPLRNKICHGDQLDFGTKEHSLKAVLVIDMLIQLAYEIARIATIKNENKVGEL